MIRFSDNSTTSYKVMNNLPNTHPFKLPPAMNSGSIYPLFKLYIVREGLNNEEYDNLKLLYKQQIKNHNLNVLKNTHSDSGFDLFSPCDTNFYGSNSQNYEENNCVNRLDFHVRVSASQCYNKHSIDKLDVDVYTNSFNLLGSQHLYSCVPLGYYLYPRSSIYKTPMRMANSVGIIDSGYRGNIMAMIDVKNGCSMNIQKGSRYFQLTSGDLKPFFVYLCDQEYELGETERGTGGFGSTTR